MKKKNWSVIKLVSDYIHLLWIIIPTSALILIFVLSCQDEIDPEAQAIGISEYIRTLNYDPGALLNVQSISGESYKDKTASDVTQPSLEDNNLLTCTESKYNLQQNAEQVAIIRPTNGIIWPGALVKINAGLLNGMPEPVTIKAAPITLRIDLPNMGEKGTIFVNEPSNSNTSTAIDKALDWWNNNAYEEGYRNASNSSYSASSSFSQEQLAIDLGLNVKWASGSVSTLFNRTSTKTQKVAMMTFKQVFYTVTLNTPTQPGIVFDPNVNIDQIKSTFSNSAPPGYVHSVSYGRMIMFRMITTESATSTEAEAAIQYGAGKLNTADVNLKTKYQNILQNSTIEVITIGGNADTASYATQAKNFGDLAHILTGSNAVYSKSNPGVPIAYTVKFLKDNKVAKMGYTTNYTANDCIFSKRGLVSVKNHGNYQIKLFIVYDKFDGQHVYLTPSGIRPDDSYFHTIPGGSKNIIIHAQTESGSKSIFRIELSGPRDCCFVTTGNLTDFKGYEVDCKNF
jgi:thiol-activated cytolysin